MNKQNILFGVFIVVVILQLFVPAKMIFEKERVIEGGKEYKFKTAPIDPSDPFRGKYITLRFEENSVVISDEIDWQNHQDVYVFLTTDSAGFAKTESVSKDVPINQQDYVKCKVNYVNFYKKKELIIDYPFDRYYMEESKAYDAEVLHRESMRDTSKVTYALVNIKHGDAVLKDVLINGISIKEIVKNRQEK